MLRRALALAAIGLLALQGAARAQGSCAAGQQHDSGQQHGTHEQMSHPGHEVPDAPADDCDTDQPRECCKAVTSCGTTDLPATDREATERIERMAIVGPTTDLLRSSVAAPEPPPPRV